MISVYSDEYQTELRYRGLIDIANQSPFDEKWLNIPGVKNIDHIQWVLEPIMCTIDRMVFIICSDQG